MTNKINKYNQAELNKLGDMLHIVQLLGLPLPHFDKTAKGVLKYPNRNYLAHLIHAEFAKWAEAQKAKNPDISNKTN